MNRIGLKLDTIRRTLLIEEAFVGVSAVLGGVAMGSGLIGVPGEWTDNLPGPLSDTPILGLCLALVVGGSSLGALASLFASRGYWATYVATYSALIALAWMVIEAADLGPATWLEPLYGTMTGLLAVLAYAYMWLSLSADEEMAGECLPVTRAIGDCGAISKGTSSAATRGEMGRLQAG